MDGPALSFWNWVLAALPVVTLFLLVLSGRVKTPHAAGIVVALTAAVGATAFRAGPDVLLVGAGKGLWLGGWILLVVWPALLLYRIASSAGMERIGQILQRLLPGRAERLLALSWVLPSFIQGVAGFGTPIAVAAPLLVGLGYSVRRALLYSLVGYHWSVTFGSMGSSFYMASLTAGLTGGEQQAMALRAAVLLGVNCVLAGALVLFLAGGLRQVRSAAVPLLAAGVAMAATLVGVAVVVPALASLAAGTAGFAVMLALPYLREASRGEAAGAASTPAASGANPDPAPDAGSEVADQGGGERDRPLDLLAPYLYLLVTALPILAFPPTRAWAQSALVVGPAFPRTVTGEGWVNQAVEQYTPIAVGAHPGTYLLLACILGYLTYRARDVIGRGRLRGTVSGWLASLPKASAPVLLLAVVATLLSDTGMVQVLAEGVAEVFGRSYPLAAASVGAVGSFMTGSTTASNALFAGFQQEVGQLLAVDPTILLAAQTAGGNVGNAIAPVVILVGLAALDDVDEVSVILRSALWPIALLVAVVTAGTVAMAVAVGG